MSTTSTNRNLVVIIAVLLLTNIAVLAYFLWFDKKAPANPDKDKNMVAEQLKNEVGFNEAQLTKYKELREKQRAKIRPMYDRLRTVKDSLFHFLSLPEVSDSAVAAAADVVAAQQKAVDLQTFTHFRNVRQICTPDQLTKYDSTILQVLQRIGRTLKKPEPPKPEK